MGRKPPSSGSQTVLVSLRAAISHTFKDLNKDLLCDLGSIAKYSCSNDASGPAEDAVKEYLQDRY